VIKLLNIFVEDTLGENRVDSQKAQEFLKQQLAQLDEELSTSEQKLAQFKRENVGRMPSESGDYFGRLQAEMTALEETRAALRIALRRQSALRQQMAGEAPTLDSNSGLQSDLDRRIDESESRLQELELRFTDKHPDVVATRETIAQLKAQKKAELSELMDAGGSGIASDNPVFQNIQIELTNVSVEIATLREQEESQQRKIAEYRDLIDVLPQVEAELARLTRDYDVKQAQYQSLLQRLEVAELSDSAEQSEDVKFRVIDPPVYPDDPVAPDRPLIILLILLAGLGAGAGISYLLNQLNPVFSDPKALRQITGYPVLGSVQTMRTSERKRWRVAQVLSFSSGVVILCGICAIVLLFHEKGSQAIQALV
jgi:polysaccharide chain length determinant protein (PEP-CTERM system associated)